MYNEFIVSRFTQNKQTAQSRREMWHYVWAHAIFHLVRWFPPSNRVKITVVTVAITLGLTIPQIYVLFLEKTKRWCPEPLLEFLIMSIIFTFFVIGFTFLFVTMVPVPRQLKVAFHVFGLITCATGMAHCILVSKSEDCQYSTPELYDISLALAVLSGVSIVYVALLLPFWIINVLRRDCVLNRPARDGFCYEPVKCCSCFWHI